MKRNIIPILSFALSGILCLFSCNNQSTTKASSGEKESKRDGMREAYEQDFEMMKDPATGTVPLQRMLVAKSYKDRLLKSRAAITGLEWASLGSKNQGGRTRTILVDANDPSGKTVFAASVGGGLWKTTDITASEPNWTPINDFMDNLAVTSITQDAFSPNIMYICTGEGYNNSDAIRGLGVWKSMNGGATWNQLASTIGSDYHFCQKVLLSNAGVLFVATKSGLQRSTDGGTSFTKVLGTGLGIAGANSDFCYDVEIAANGDVFASLNASIHKSTDAGITFGTAQSVPIPMSRIELACAPNDANYVFALVESTNVVRGILRTIDGGANWISRSEPDDADPDIPSTDFSRSQAWYDLAIAVDPGNKDVLFVGGIDIFKSVDGASTWSQVSHWYGGFGSQYAHADQHFIHFAQGSSSVIYFTNDGGVYRTTNGTAAVPTLVDKGTNYVTTQFYGCAIHPTAQKPYYLAGAQDNGTHRFTSNTVFNTTEVTGGDGAFCNIDQNEPQFQFAQYTRNNYYRSTDGGNSYTFISESNSGRFINPTDYDDVNNILYAARSASQYVRWNNPQIGSSFTTVSVPAFGGQVSAVKVSPNTNNRVFFGMGVNGQVFKVDNANATPTATSISTGLPAGFVSCIEVETGNDDHILVTYSNFGVNSVWETINGGTTWTSVEGNLPDMPIRWALFNPNNNDQVILATELGVWSTDNLNGGTTVWGTSNTGLANVRVDQLQLRASDGYMIASTHGRGLFGSDFYTNPAAIFEASTVIGYTGASVQFSNSSYKDVSWNWSFGDGNTSILQSPTHVYTQPGFYTVTLTINGGVSTITKNQYIQILPNKSTPYVLTDGGNFEVNAGDFGADNANGIPWERGNSAIGGKDGTLSGSFAWVTGLTAPTYGNDCDLRLMSPNFNLSAAGTYTLKFHRKHIFQSGADGFRVEYTLNKGASWTPLGTTVSANWYDFANASGFTAFPLGEAFFSGTINTFTLCQFDISALAGNPNVAFRIRTKSELDQSFAGAAIDDFELLGPPNIALPLNLNNFAVAKKENIAAVTWTSINETNVSHYELERSLDGKSFSQIDRQEATNQNNNSYAYNDDISSIQKTQSTVYYRLKMVDNDQQYKYSEVRDLKFASQGTIAIAPNPFYDHIEVITQDQIHQVTLYSVVGRKIFQLQNPTTMKVVLPSDLTAGIYILVVETNNQKHVQQIVKSSN